MPFFIELLDTLHAADMPVPYAIRDRDGNGLRELCGKPALLQPRLSGKHIKAPNAQHCAQVGELLAHIHLATREHIIERRTDRGLDWMLASGAELLPRLTTEQAALLQPALDEIRAHKAQILALPRANLHADLFRDNVMFEGTHLTGVIDFYNACSGPMLYDIAITVNDWCLDEHGAVDVPRAQALLAAYAALRPFTAAEAELWPEMLRVGCVRFWLSRLIAAESFAGMDVMIHDPSEFEVRLAAPAGGLAPAVRPLMHFCLFAGTSAKRSVQARAAPGIRPGRYPAFPASAHSPCHPQARYRPRHPARPGAPASRRSRFRPGAVATAAR